MAKGVVEKQYWDACLFLDLVNETKGRAEKLAAMLDALKTDGGVVAYTSMLTITEAAGIKDADDKIRVPPKKVIAAIDHFWSVESPIRLVELYQTVAHEARGLMREAAREKFSLKPHDAIHFATASRVGASRFFTYDQGLFKYNERWGFTVGEPSSEQLPFEGAAD